MTDYRTVIAEYEALVEKAQRVTSETYHLFADIIVLSHRDDMARLTCIKFDQWSDTTLEHYDFPAAALALSDEEGRAMVRAHYDEENARQSARVREREAANERAQYERLKAKFEGGA